MTVPLNHLAALLGWLVLSSAHAAPLNEAEALLRQGNVPAALAAVQQQLERDPADLAAQELYVDLMTATGRGDEALAEARARAAASPTNADRQYLLGRAAADPQAAERAYRAALALAPRHARATMGIASIDEARGNISGAATGYHRAAELDPSLVEAWVGATRTEVRLGATAAALNTARDGLRRHPFATGLLVVLAHLAPAEADPKLQAAVAASPWDAALQDAYAETRLALDDARTALASAQRALAMDASSVSAARTATWAREQLEGRLDGAGRSALLAATALEANDRTAALGRYASLADQYPRSASVWVARSRARRAAGDSEGALQDLVRAAAADPAHVDAQAGAGAALFDAKRYADAVPPLSRASTARPNDVVLQLLFVQAQANSGAKAEALTNAEALAARYPYHADVILLDATQLAAAGRTTDAYDRLKPALLKTADPRLAALFVQIAPAAGHPEEAAAILDQIVKVTGNAQLAEAARRLRAMSTSQGRP